MFKNFVKRYVHLIAKIPERHYWPLFIVIPYSEFVVTLGALGYFKFEKSYRKFFAKVISPLPDVIKYGGSVIFFLVMLDDTIFYASIILLAFWSNRQVKKINKSEE